MDIQLKKLIDLQKNKRKVDTLLANNNISSILLASFFCVVISLISLLAFNWQQAKSLHELAVNTLEPLQVKLAQQNHLIYLKQLISKIVDLNEINDLPELHAQITLQSESLSLLNSKNKNTYQQWFEGNLSSTKLLKRITDNYKSNVLVKEHSLIKLEKLIIASKIVQYNQSTPTNRAMLIVNMIEQFNALAKLITAIRLPMLHTDYKQNDQAIRSLLVNGLLDDLINQNNVDQHFESIIRSYQLLKGDLLRKEGLINFQENIFLLEKYQRNLREQERELEEILSAQLTPDLRHNSLNKVFNINESSHFDTIFLPVWLIILLLLSLSSLCCLFLLLNSRLGALKVAFKESQVKFETLIQSLERDQHTQQENITGKVTADKQTLTSESVKTNDSEIKNDNELQQSLQNYPLQAEIQRTPLSTFNLDGYISNQGSAELAFFMLDQYIEENKVFVKALNNAFEDNDIDNIKDNIDSLTKNAKILAAKNLLQLCKQWQLNEACMHSLEKKLSQKQLLSLITQSVSHLEKTAAIID
jgi:HPt (histidine-containing phosphotransfer) domain-containing protein